MRSPGSPPASQKALPKVFQTPNTSNQKEAREALEDALPFCIARICYRALFTAETQP